VPNEAFCGGPPSIVIIIFIPIRLVTCIRPGTQVSCTVMWVGYFLADTRGPTS